MGKHIKTFETEEEYFLNRDTFTDKHVVFIRELYYVDFGDYFESDDSNLNEFGLEGDLIITAESNPPVFAALNDAGIPYDTTAGGYTIADLAAITDEDLMPLNEDGEASSETTVFCNKPIVNFNEFKYFTGIDGTCFYESASDVRLFGDEPTLKQITIPSNISCEEDVFMQCFMDCELDCIAVEEGNQLYDSRGNCNAVISKSTNTLVRATNNTTIPTTVTAIGEGAFSRLTINTITIPEHITEIGEAAFRYCENLTSATILGDITEISSSMFRSCTSLTNITIPSSVTSIGWGAFQYCTSLPSIAIPNSVTSIGNYAFSSCTSLTNITIPSSVTSIGSSTFNICTSLQSITIPSSVTSIAYSTFNGCTSLTNITIPSSVTNIGLQAFYGCTSLQSITIPSSVTSISDYAFYNCSSLNSITCNATTPPTIYSHTFQNIGSSGFLTVQTASETQYYNGWIKGTQTYYLGYYGWRINAIVLTEQSNPTLFDILNDAGIPYDTTAGGYRIANLAAITDEQLLSDIDPYKERSSDDYCISIFYNASQLESFDEFQYFKGVSSDITAKTSGKNGGSLGFFQGCTRLESIVLPSHLSIIGSHCFDDCPIKEITIPQSVTKIDTYAFCGTDITRIELPSSVQYVSANRALACRNLTEIVCNGTTAPTFSSVATVNNIPFGYPPHDGTTYIPSNGTLYYPEGADYSSWMSTSTYFLGWFQWDEVEF